MPDSHPEGRTAIQKDEPDAKAAHTPMNDQTFRNGDTRAAQLIERPVHQCEIYETAQTMKTQIHGRELLNRSLHARRGLPRSATTEGRAVRRMAEQLGRMAEPLRRMAEQGVPVIRRDENAQRSSGEMRMRTAHPEGTVRRRPEIFEVRH